MIMRFSPSILRRLFLSFMGFGLSMGLIFPFYAQFFVEWKPGMYIWFSIGCLVAGGSIGLFNYFLTRLVLLSRLQELSRLTANVSNKDLSTSCKIKSDDVVGEIVGDFNNMVLNLRDIVAELDKGAHELGLSFKTLEVASQLSNAEIQQQREELEQAASATNQLVASANEVLKYSSEAQVASQTADDEGSAAKVVTVEAMGVVDNLASQVGRSADVIRELKGETDNISQMLSVINDIAEQTNLLALNAAIEAARAGEQGRGFAVVADEVRSLATRTQQSTREVAEIIDRLQVGADRAVEAMESAHNLADEGVAFSERTAEALAALSGSMSIIVSMNSQIANAAREQTSVSESINQNIHRINSSSEKASHSSQEVATTCDRVGDLAHRLQEIVSSFRTH